MKTMKKRPQLENTTDIHKKLCEGERERGNLFMKRVKQRNRDPDSLNT